MRIVWTRPLAATPLGLSLACEAGSLLVWESESTLVRLDSAGRVELRQRSPVTPVAVAMSDDGRLVAVAGRRGQVCLMTLDLVPIWERTLPRKPTALAIDHLGRRLAVADDAGGVFVFDREGHEVWRASAARPLTRLAFVPEAPALIGAAEFGLVCAFDGAGTCTWRDGLVAHVGSLAASGSGDLFLLACFNEGLCTYALGRPRSQRLPMSPPVRLAALDYRGETIVAGGLEGTLFRCAADGSKQLEVSLAANPVALCVEALGGAAMVALGDGTLVRVEMSAAQG